MTNQQTPDLAGVGIARIELKQPGTLPPEIEPQAVDGLELVLVVDATCCR